MKPLTDAELIAHLEQTETDRVERKRAWAGQASDTVRQAVCAFANDLPNYRLPGVVFIGVNDDGSLSNIDVSDQLLKTLSDIKSDGQILPPPTLTVDRRTLKGAHVAVVTVWPADSPPVRYSGRVWIRLGPVAASPPPKTSESSMKSVVTRTEVSIPIRSTAAL